MAEQATNIPDRTFEDRVQEWQDQIESRVRRVSKGSWARILRMARKPTKQEFRQTAWVCGIGLGVLGAIGFAILVAMDNLIPWLFDFVKDW